MSDPYVGEIILFAGNFAPYGYLFCDGSLLSISDHSALFQLIGTTYGGDGVNNFAIPDLRGRIALGTGQRPANASYTLGQQAGQENVSLTSAQLPSHSHLPNCTTNAGNTASPSNAIWAQVTGAAGVKGGQYSTSTTYVSMGTVTGPAGGSGAHPNRQPVLALNFCISTDGIYPTSS